MQLAAEGSGQYPIYSCDYLALATPPTPTLRSADFESSEAASTG